MFELFPEAVVWRCSVEKVFLQISKNSQENTCAWVSFLIILQALGLQLYLKETLAQVFFCEFSEISKSTCFNRTPLLAASVFTINKVISSHQSGFNPGHSCINQLLFITHEIYTSFLDGLEVRDTFLGLSKAFDKV